MNASAWSGRRRALAVAVLLAAVSALVLVVYVRGLERRALANADPVEVLVATGIIPAGMSIEDATANGLVEPRPLPRSALIEGAAVEPGSLAGRVTTTDILPGEQLADRRFAAPGTAGSVLPIPPDRQAVAVEVALPPGVGGFVRPGDHVSVIARIDQPQRGPRVAYLVQGVQVLAVNDRSLSEEPEEEQEHPTERVLLTLALLPAEAEQVVFSVLQGDVYFTLLPAGQAPTDTPGRTVDDVFAR